MDRVSMLMNARFEKIEKINDEFTRCKCYIMALGKNRNGSYISREAAEAAIPSFVNIPVIAFLYEGEDGKMHVAGHEMKIVENESGYEFRTKCCPYGVVPDCKFEFEDVVENDGTTATYLTGEVILWSGKYPEIMEAIYSDDVYFNQSMEIKVLETKEFSEDSRYIDIVKFNPSALCLLGKSDEDEYNVEPCFPSSSVIPFSLDDEFTKLMDEFKQAFANSSTVEIVEESMEEEFEESDPVEVSKVEIEEEVPVEEPEEHEEPVMSKFDALFATHNQKREMVDRALCALNINDDDNKHYVHHWAIDFDDAYIYVERHEYKDDAGDHCYGRFAYEMNEEANEIHITSDMEEMWIKWLTADELETLQREKDDFVAYKASHSVANDEVEELREFKAKRLAEDHRIDVENVLAAFDDLSGNAEFEALREKAIEYEDMNELENQCYAIRGKSVKVGISQKQKGATIPIVGNINNKPSAEDEYGGLFSMYNLNK